MVPRMPRSHLTHALIIQKTQIENTTNKLKHKRPRLLNILPQIASHKRNVVALANEFLLSSCTYFL
jgi:hypothetical protein